MLIAGLNLLRHLVIARDFLGVFTTHEYQWRRTESTVWLFLLAIGLIWANRNKSHIAERSEKRLLRCLANKNAELQFTIPPPTPRQRDFCCPIWPTTNKNSQPLIILVALSCLVVFALERCVIGKWDHVQKVSVKNISQLVSYLTNWVKNVYVLFFF